MCKLSLQNIPGNNILQKYPGKIIQVFWKKYPNVTHEKNIPGKNIHGCRQNVISTFCLISDKALFSA
jgi:hypothetical protein